MGYTHNTTTATELPADWDAIIDDLTHQATVTVGHVRAALRHHPHDAEYLAEVFDRLEARTRELRDLAAEFVAVPGTGR